MEREPVSIIDQTERYINTKTELYTLKLSGKLARILSSVISQLFFGLIGIIVLFLLAVGFSLWIGERMENSYIGFLIIAGALSGLSLLFYLFRYRMIQKPLMDILVSQLLKEKDNA
jgi:hypothetical protein